MRKKKRECKLGKYFIHLMIMTIKMHNCKNSITHTLNIFLKKQKSMEISYIQSKYTITLILLQFFLN